MYKSEFFILTSTGSDKFCANVEANTLEEIEELAKKWLMKNSARCRILHNGTGADLTTCIITLADWDIEDPLFEYILHNDLAIIARLNAMLKDILKK